MTIITKTEDLELFCQNIATEEFITIDTEFSRESTYYPKLCLLQIASSKKAVIIDTLSQELELYPLNEILLDPKIVKVFHSAKQDLEILYLLNKTLPNNIFDTQIAASFCGFGELTSYESLTWKLLHKKIDKSYRISDWTQRPLMLKQIEYALGDVIYLRKIYQLILEILQENKRLTWVIEEIKNIYQENNFITDVTLAWKKIKNFDNRKLNLIIRELATWREIKAQEFNLPRNHYLKEKTLLKLAHAMPLNIEEVKNITGLNNIDNYLAEEIVYIIQNALSKQIEEDLYQQVETNNHYQKNPELVSLLKLLLQLKAKEYNIPAHILATHQELKSLCNENNLKESRILKGWRYEVFGKLALEIKEGNIALTIEGREIKLLDKNNKNLTSNLKLTSEQIR